MKKLYSFAKGKLPFLAAILAANYAQAQVSFTDNSSLLTSDTHSGCAIGCVDMDGDFKDDVIRLEGTNDLYIDYQVTGNPFTENHIGSTGSSNEWSLCVGDVDRNGYNDLFVGDYNRSAILIPDNTGANHVQTTIASGIFVQGSNMMDINTDGHLDIFACDDDDMSSIYVGDGTGAFVNNQGLMPLATVPASDNSGNYATIWTDYDSDGDVDMYLSKCRQGVSDPTDPRRINQMYENDGSNNYTEVGIPSGLANGAQTWTSEFQDIDNDGDMDVFMLHHDVPNELWENNGNGTFTDITAGSGLEGLSFNGIQCVLRDFDNDGFADLLITGSEEHLFWNNGNKTFTAATGTPFDNNTMHTVGVGDLNDDGFLDMVAGYGSGFNSPSGSRTDKIYFNDGNSNNWLTFNLTGTQSNINGIHAWVEVYGAWGMQVREVHSGGYYGIQNSLNPHFGLGTACSIDSIIIKWPSGMVDRMYGETCNQIISVTEGTFSSVGDLSVAGVEFSVAPNPFSELTTISISNYDFATNGHLTLTVFDLAGKIVNTQDGINTDKVVLSRGNLESGVYLYQVSNDQGILHSERLTIATK
jgi:hypothetical protein